MSSKSTNLGFLRKIFERRVLFIYLVRSVMVKMCQMIPNITALHKNRCLMRSQVPEHLVCCEPQMLPEIMLRNEEKG